MRILALALAVLFACAFFMWNAPLADAPTVPSLGAERIVETVREQLNEAVIYERKPSPEPAATQEAAPPTGAGATATSFKVFGAIPYWDQDRAIALFKEHVTAFDAITVFWYKLNEDGSIAKYRYAREDLSLIQYAHAHGVKVFALIANLPENAGWDYRRVDRAIGSQGPRTAHIAAIMALVREKGYDGVNIDYESLRDSQTEDFTAFIAELASALHAEGKELKIAIHSQRKGTETRGQDMFALAASADYLGFMTYDQHWDESDPGANAEIDWMREVLSYARSLGVPMRKVLLGIPLDGYNWPGEDGEWGKASGVTYHEALQLAEREGADIEYDKDVEAPHFAFGNSDGSYNDVWFEDVRSFEPKYELAKEFGVGGIALWKFGSEDERVYDRIMEDR